MTRHDSRRWTGRFKPGEEPPEFARPYRRRSAPWVLGGFILLAIGLAAIQPMAPHDDRLPLVWPLLFTIAFGNTLSPFARGLFALRRDADDEFVDAMLTRAASQAYRLLALFGGAMFCWIAAAADRGWPAPHRFGDWIAWAGAFLLVASALPALIAEITIPFPVEEDDAE